MKIPTFKQVSDMRKPHEIKSIVEQNTPVFVLKNSEICFVAISKNQYEEFAYLKGRQELHAKLAVAEAEDSANCARPTHDEVFSQLRAKTDGI